jgi:hypothetical protein
VDAISGKRAEEAAAMARVVEEEGVARREHNNALIEFRRVEEVEAALLDEERHASQEARVSSGPARPGPRRHPLERLPPAWQHDARR